MTESCAAQRYRALLKHAEEVAQIGFWEWSPARDELRWSDNLFRLMGLEPGQIAPSREYASERTHPDDRQRVDRYAERLKREGRLPPINYRMILPDGTVRHHRSTVAGLEEVEGRPPLIAGAVQDLTDQRRAGRVNAAHIVVAEALAEWRSLEESGERLVRGLAEAMGCVGGGLWIPKGDVLVTGAFWYADTVDLSGSEGITRELRFPRGSGLPGQVWKLRRPIAVVSTHDDPRFCRRPSVAKHGLRGAIALPALAGEELLAVVELHSPEEIELTRRLTRSLTGIGHQLGQFLASHRMELEPPSLTDREREVLSMIATGGTNAEIAERLVVAQSTVAFHVKNILRKMGAGNRTEAASRYFHPTGPREDSLGAPTGTGEGKDPHF